MEESKKLPIRVSKEFNLDLDQVYIYGYETFGARKAQFYENEIWKLVEGLSYNWLFFKSLSQIPPPF